MITTTFATVLGWMKSVWFWMVLGLIAYVGVILFTSPPKAPAPKPEPAPIVKVEKIEPVPVPAPSPHKRKAKPAKKHARVPQPVFKSTPAAAYSCETVKGLADRYSLSPDELASAAAKRGVPAGEIKRLRGCFS